MQPHTQAQPARAKSARRLTLFIVTFGMIGTATPADAARTGEWVARMDGLATALTALLTDASSGQGDDAKRERMRAHIGTLRTLAHDLQEMGAVPDADPTIPWLLAELDASIEGTARADDTRIEEAVFAVAWTCMACHTRAGVGTPRPIAALAPLDASLPADVRGTALAATRRFTEARSVFRAAAFNEGFAANEPTRWERAVRGAILLDLRLSHDVRGALEVTEQVLHTPDGEHLWADAADWRRTLVSLSKTTKARASAPAALAAEAQRLMDDAALLAPTHAGREILFVKTTAVVHELLMRAPPKAMRAQALAWLGESYSGLRDLDIWHIHLLYDAACVEAVPHSLLAAECYERWRDGARSAFLGNGGGELPPDLAERERSLRVLAGTR